MTQRKAKLIHHRDNILTNLRKVVWDGQVNDNDLKRLAEGKLAFGDGNLIKTLAVLAIAELAIGDEDAAEF